VINFCPGCFEKQRKIDALTEEVKRLKARLNYLERKEKCREYLKLTQNRYH